MLTYNRLVLRYKRKLKHNSKKDIKTKKVIILHV